MFQPLYSLPTTFVFNIPGHSWRERDSAATDAGAANAMLRKTKAGFRKVIARQ
jgi:hypothetical protein